jgi:hypothetical protein
MKKYDLVSISGLSPHRISLVLFDIKKIEISLRPAIFAFPGVRLAHFITIRNI